MYVNWFPNHGASPKLHNLTDISEEWLNDVRNQTMDLNGQYHDTSKAAQASEPKRGAIRSCYYNGVANSTCFLFARKIEGHAGRGIGNLPESVLGF
jgi:hypothetical protein